MLRMSLAWKAAALILLNVVLTLTAGLMARNYILNPELAKVERTNDEKILHQLKVLESVIHADMLESVRRLKGIAARVDEDRWEGFATSLSELAGASDLSYVIAASSDGDLLQVRPGRYFNYSQSPSPTEINRIVSTAVNHQAGFPLIELLEGDTSPLVIAAERLEQRNPQSSGPSLFIGVARIDPAFIARLGEFSGVDLSLINRDRFAQIKQAPRALSGLRSSDNTLHWSLENSAGEPVLMTEVSLPPRSYDDRILTPTLMTALLITLATWCVTIWLLYRTLVRPVNQASQTLQSIMADKDYGRKLQYPHHDELGRLITFLNRLLGMVDRHTAELETLSLTDPLTELNNRRAFDTQSKRFWALAERSQTRMALIAFDIDHFKSYNDNYGHPAGDKVIQHFARVLEGTFKRASDVVARTGGEEFLVLTHDTPAGACLVLANRALQELRDLRLEHNDNPIGVVSASAGVFHTTPDPNITLEIALTRVDEILYAAKEAGRNRVMHSEALVNDVKQATTAEVVQLTRK